METGPLARQWISAVGGKLQNEFIRATPEGLEMDLPKFQRPACRLHWRIPERPNALERNRARAYHIAYCGLMALTYLLKAFDYVRRGETRMSAPYTVPDEAIGVGFWEAGRGTLTHHAVIEAGRGHWAKALPLVKEALDQLNESHRVNPNDPETRRYLRNQYQTLAEVLRSSPRPVVVVPRQLPDGQGIVVAYGGGREAARTLQTFQLLGLAAGESIEVVTVHRDGAQAEALAHRAGDYLSAHGAPHRLHAIASAASPAEVLLEQVQHARPRLVVMGAHGYHPLRELFSTSVTRSVLRACPVPVFVGA